MQLDNAMPLQCLDWPTEQDPLEQARLEGYRANNRTIDLSAEECAEGTLVICWVKRTWRSSAEINLPFWTEVVTVPLATSSKGLL